MVKHTKIASNTLGRTRMKLSSGKPNPDKIARIANAYKAPPKVNRFETNLYAGTIIVHHKEQAPASIKNKLKRPAGNID